METVKKRCPVCDELREESSFIRPCGKVSSACRSCRLGKLVE